ncbi:MAG: ABC transporter transmembrane domain-containing protein, partial [Clostridia bacterium]
MSQYIQIFKQWYRLARPNKKYWILQFISVTIPSICLVFESYYLAKVTTCVSAGNWSYAIANLIIAFAILVIRTFCWDFNYRNTFKLVGRSYLRIQKQLYDKIIGSTDTNLNTNSKEKLINIMHGAVYDTSNFADIICSKYRFLISAFICIGYVIFANLYIGLVMVAVFILNIIILRKINDKISRAVKQTKVCVDHEYEAFSDAIESQNFVEELGIKEKVRDKTLDASYDYMKSKYKYNVAYSYLDNYFYMLYRFVRFGLTIALIFLLKGDLITLTAYFVMVSYIADTLSYNNDFCKLFTELKNVDVAVTRVNIILNFDDRKTLNLGDIDSTNSGCEIDFIDVYYTADNDEFKLQNLYDVSFHIDNNECVVFKGDRSSGKRTIFYLLRRMVEVNSGE